MANNTEPLHLWDNSWHVKEPSDSARDRYGRKPCPLNYRPKIDISCLRTLKSLTISEMIEADEADVIVWPQSFIEGFEAIKDQYIFQISEKDGKRIDSITTGNIVGFIGKGDTHIRIHSRFSAIDKKDKNKWEVKNDYFLYYMLEKVMAINLFDLNTKSSSDKERVFDLLIFFFPKLLKDALSQGLYKKYVYREYNDSNIRGVVDVSRHIRHNIPANGRIAYRTREYSYDNPVTQLIRHTIEFIRRKRMAKQILHNDPDTESFVQQIVQATPTFQAQKRQVIINMNLRPVVHPYYTKYAALQNLCLRILRYDKLSYEAANDKKIHGLLIDAAWLWEEYIAKVLSERTNLRHYTRNNSNFHLFKDGKPFQRIIPDYYDEANGVVADAKYMPLHLYDHLDADRATGVYYKTIMYMYRFNTQTGFLFYPYQNDKEDDEYKIESIYQIEDRTDCHLYEVGLEIEEIKETTADYTIFREKMVEKEKVFVEKVINYINDISQNN